jgi:hypothetical protein
MDFEVPTSVPLEKMTPIKLPSEPSRLIRFAFQLLAHHDDPVAALLALI